jgi:hypothetical protein
MTYFNINRQPSEVDDDSVTFQSILEVVDKIQELDERRRTTFREEFEAECDTYVGTKTVIASQKSELETLDAYLSFERKKLEKLIEESNHLSVNQAVENRDKAIEKIDRHNQFLKQFHDRMVDFINCFEVNLEYIEREGPNPNVIDCQFHLKKATSSLNDHNIAIEGLSKNLDILNQYLR